MAIILAILPYVFLGGGLVLLIKGADVFVDSASGIAKAFHIPTIVIGLTIVAFGTSAPEAAVSITATINGSADISVGNVLGSNIFNLLPILGVCALIKPVNVDKQILRRDYPLLLLASAALLALGADSFLGEENLSFISRGDGIIFLLIFCVFLYITFQAALPQMKASKELEGQRLEAHVEEEEKGKKKLPLWLLVILCILSIAAIVGGGQLAVMGASDIARSFGISEKLIALTIVAVGTSAPELVTSIIAALKGDTDIAVGNVIGSNIFNILFVSGISATINPLAIPDATVIDALINLAITILLYIFIFTSKKINRVEGAIAIAIYIAYVLFSIFR